MSDGDPRIAFRDMDPLLGHAAQGPGFSATKG